MLSKEKDHFAKVFNFNFFFHNIALCHSLMVMISGGLIKLKP